MRIAVLTSEFPAVSETFVLDQVADLIERDLEVDVYPERPPAAPGVTHPAWGRLGLAQRTRYAPPMPVPKLARVWGAARLLAANRRRPAPLLRSVNPLAYGRSAVSLSLLYRQVPLLGARGYDVVHCHHGPVALAAAQLRSAGVFRAPLVATFHGHDANVVPVVLGDRAYAPLFRAAEQLTVNSEFLRDRLLALGADPRRVGRYPVGVDLEAFSPRSPPRLHGADLRVLSVARLVEEKGIAVALRAVGRLLRRFPMLRYDVVGDGPQRTGLERMARALGVGARVHFVGAQPHDRVRQFHADADVFLLPSVVGADGSEESQGLALIEAQASGVPVVASAIGGVPESLRDGVTGHLFPAGDSEALAERLTRLLAHPEQRVAMGRAGRAFVEQHFD
jgi:colanic acid/amylovoran biosynthesis glycosyltransferase